jgi:hypothetical protein
MNAEPGLLAFGLAEKIHSRHNDRQAIVYVRQSTVRQVEHNRESTRLQYALADRAFRLGWRRDCKNAPNNDPTRLAVQGIGVVAKSSIWELSPRFQW